MSSTRDIFLKLAAKRERWGLTWRGRLVVAVLLATLLTLGIRRVHPFLASTDRVDAQVLVIEGWVHNYALVAALQEANQYGYVKLLTTGGPVAGDGGYTNDFNTSAGVALDRLRKMGVPNDRLAMAPSRVSARDRTYASAIALAEWLAANEPAVQSINVVTEDFHARRTRLLFQTALGKKMHVGVIAVPNPDYDQSRWWRFSEGVREAIGEMIAYVYAKVFFRPSGKI